MVHEGTEDINALAAAQRSALGGRPPKAEREEALGLCVIDGCDWMARSERKAISVMENALQDQQRIHDGLYAHAVGTHGLDAAAIVARDCNDVRVDLRVPEPSPPPGQARYLRCTARFYVLADDDPAEALREAYHTHWDLCPATEAARRSRQDEDHGIVYTRLDPLLPNWKHVP